MGSGFLFSSLGRSCGVLKSRISSLTNRIKLVAKRSSAQGATLDKARVLNAIYVGH